MLIVFSVVSYWCYGQINKSNSLGIVPKMHIDILAVNLVAQIGYCFTEKALWVYILVPIWALWKALTIARTFFTKGLGGVMGLDLPSGSDQEGQQDQKSNR